MARKKKYKRNKYFSFCNDGSKYKIKPNRFSRPHVRTAVNTRN